MSFFFPCKYKKVIRVLKSFGLVINEREKHTKAECVNNGKKTTIPRHTEVKREIVKSICDFLLEKDFKEEEILRKMK